MFETKGEKARWKYIYDLLQRIPDNGILTYERMGEVLGLDPVRDRQAIVQALRRAAKEHEEVDKRAVTVVPNKGYRIAAPREHLELAKRHQRRSSKALARGQSKVVNVDLSKLDPEARKAFEVVASAFAAQMDFNRRAERKLRDHSSTIESLKVANDRSEAEREQLLQRVAEIEARLNSK